VQVVRERSRSSGTGEGPDSASTGGSSREQDVPEHELIAAEWREGEQAHRHRHHHRQHRHRRSRETQEEAEEAERLRRREEEEAEALEVAGRKASELFQQVRHLEPKRSILKRDSAAPRCSGACSAEPSPVLHLRGSGGQHSAPGEQPELGQVAAGALSAEGTGHLSPSYDAPRASPLGPGDSSFKQLPLRASMPGEDLGGPDGAARRPSLTNAAFASRNGRKNVSFSVRARVPENRVEAPAEAKEEQQHAQETVERPWRLGDV
jgi:hypothetical protein